ncbi:M16 family metallopeptidase [Prochlorococcus marinus]|uniref:Insulinase family protein n=1 Tax=Prochlorococcus marinus XMU1408 TaxID=2213228 RepID=A0A318R5L4_PROMR|nr:pitrilysin family protein [Prochlorococcus marinus]MBW3041747.1 insulinase family protein [Prochlorococcus marinus str. XMU1408]PYE02892.1 insulinase family protein [Prochlorococcus marinus XMU1408]
MDVDHWLLPNGATCIVADMKDSTLTCIDFWCKGGSNCESRNEEGMAHFLEHMIFKGSKNLEEGEFDLKIESLGGSSNAATGLDDVHYHVLVPPEKLEEALSLLLELLLFPKIEKEAFEMEKEVVLEEIAQNIDQPDEIIYMNLLKECCSPHRYSRPILGDKKTIKNIIPKQMKLFHENHYVGKNCTLCIAGKIPKEIYSIINNSKLQQLKIIKEDSTTNNQLNFNKGYKKEVVPRLEGARIVKAWKLPPAKEQRLILGVEIAATILCEGRSSLIVRKLREEKRIIESIEIDLQILEEGGLILLDTYCSLENLKIAESEVNNILKESTKNLFNKNELDRAKKLVLNNIYFNLELSTQIASTLGSQALWGRNHSILESIKEISYWTSERLNEFIFPLFNPENSFTLIAEPGK